MAKNNNSRHREVRSDLLFIKRLLLRRPEMRAVHRNDANLSSVACNEHSEGESKPVRLIVANRPKQNSK
jgi:hypothetical protein